MFVLGLFDSMFNAMGVGQDFNLLMLGFKIVILLYIIQFFKNRFGESPVVTLLVAGVAYLFLFTSYFKIFGPMMFVYLFVIFGFTSILFDLAIAKPWKSMDMHGEMEAGEEEGGHGVHHSFKEAQHQQHSLRKMRARY